MRGIETDAFWPVPHDGQILFRCERVERQPVSETVVFDEKQVRHARH
jgi:hypothetical protein